MKAVVWSKQNCGFCTSAKMLLKKHNIEIDERIIGEGWTKEQLLEAVPLARTVPQIFLNEEYVGGFNELKKRLE